MTSSLHYSATTAILLLVAAASGCTTATDTSVTYSYDPSFSFSGPKTYAWVKSRPYGHSALVEANVRFLADRDFQAKGLSLNGGQACSAPFSGGRIGSDGPTRPPLPDRLLVVGAREVGVTSSTLSFV